jgi:hypothetical protein
MVWAMNLAPIPLDEGGKAPKPSTACAFVLVGLANHADHDGTDAFPSVRTLCRYTRLSERTVRTCLDRLQAEGVIRPNNPDLVAAKIRRGDRRPQGWHLAMDRMRDDLTDDDLDAIATSNPFLRPWIEAHRPAARGATDADSRSGRGATDAGRGAMDAERGAATAPEPSFEQSLTRPEETSSSVAKLDVPRDDVEALCVLLADLIEENGSLRPTITKTWRREARLLLDKDGREFAKAANLIRWCQSDVFWKSNIMSMPKFRAQYDVLRMKATERWEREQQRRDRDVSTTDARVMGWQAYKSEFGEEPGDGPAAIGGGA